ncbi:hypothetical protein EVAR_41098_1 [Eumeta japonica]|uniref:Uncharacterized protein n=1 Tax=Eumeta variegata TaxID=151549 RepID=A0A4C1XEL1_EUMVA|nr:hypothetical protein EVAR_41098_1 [Eumeta japonica]
MDFRELTPHTKQYLKRGGGFAKGLAKVGQSATCPDTFFRAAWNFMTSTPAQCGSGLPTTVTPCGEGVSELRVGVVSEAQNE